MFQNMYNLKDLHGLKEGLLLEKLNRVKVQGWTQQKLEQT
jgi:hypothetical protein